MQQFALLCIKKITIKNDSMTDTTREVKGESLSNAFKWWTSEHIKKKNNKNKGSLTNSQTASSKCKQPAFKWH